MLETKQGSSAVPALAALGFTVESQNSLLVVKWGILQPKSQTDLEKRTWLSYHRRVDGRGWQS